MQQLKEEVRAAVDCDPNTWVIMPINPTAGGFDDYWSLACGAPLDERMSYAIRRRADRRVVGMSSYYTPWPVREELRSALLFFTPTFEEVSSTPRRSY